MAWGSADRNERISFRRRRFPHESSPVTKGWDRTSPRFNRSASAAFPRRKWSTQTEVSTSIRRLFRPCDGGSDEDAARFRRAPRAGGGPPPPPTPPRARGAGGAAPP